MTNVLVIFVFLTSFKILNILLLKILNNFQCLFKLIIKEMCVNIRRVVYALFCQL